MKKVISLALIVVSLAVFFTGCGKKDRLLYNDVKLTKFVDLGDYKGIPVDTSSDTFKGYYDDVIANDVKVNGLYITKNEGTVADGDIANIDYVGKKDGVAFEGGTAEGYDLKIGSGSFIDGFESGLIGVAVGQTVDLNLKFPETYQNSELAGAAVVFTVTVNYITTEDPRSPEDYFAELNFKTLESYKEDVNKRAINQYLFDTLSADSKVKDYPEKDLDYIFEKVKEVIASNIQSSYGVDLETYLGYIGQTQEDFESSIISEQVKPMMDEQMVAYALLDAEKIEVTSEDVENEITKTIEENGYTNVSNDTLKEFYGEYYFEGLAATDKAIEFLYNNAKIS